MLDRYLEVACQAAKLGGDVLLEMLGKAEVWPKGIGDLVTQADLSSQQVIREHLLRQFPDHQFLGEEDASFEEVIGEQSESKMRWIVDPLDGTLNYVHQLGMYSVSIALCCGDETQVGVVYDPTLDQCFAAAVGQGATCNGRSIETSGCDALGDALVGFSMNSYTQPGDVQLQRLMNVIPSVNSVRRLGSAALNLSLVASGRLDAYWATNLKPWDVAAGWLIAEEAGATIKDFSGEPLDLNQPRFCAAGTEMLYDALQVKLNL